MHNAASALMDWPKFERQRAELGPLFIKVIGYFREDGLASLQKVEAAVRAGSAVQLVAPAHKLKGEARQVGAEALGSCAEKVELEARHLVEIHGTPDELIPDVVELRRLWSETLAAIDAEVSPLMQRGAPQRGFGRRPAAANQGFGRL